jgi:hypothetical protein
MRIKKLFKTESDYLDYVWTFLSFDESKIWRDEDLSKLEPYFNLDRSDKNDMSDSEWTILRESMKHYEKCLKDYADALFEIRDSINGFMVEKLTEFFLLEDIDQDCEGYDDQGNEIDENGDIIPPLSRETIKIAEEWKDEMVFPLYFVGCIDSGFDRLGDACFAYSEFVSLKEFNQRK